MSYLQEELNISLFDNKSSNPTKMNPEDLVDLDLSDNSSKSYNKTTVRTYDNGIIKDVLITGVESMGSAITAISIDLGCDKILSNPDRLFLMSDGSYKLAKDIKKLDKLMGISSDMVVNDVEEIPLMERIYTFDIFTEPYCENVLLSSGAFAGRILREVEGDLTKGVSEGFESLSL